MEKTYLQVLISAENKKQADAILLSLLKNKLVIGGMIIEAPARFWWKEKIIKMKYVNILAFTSANYQKRIIKDVEEVSIEEVPMVAFSKIDGNEKFLNWINKSIK